MGGRRRNPSSVNLRTKTIRRQEDVRRGVVWSGAARSDARLALKCCAQHFRADSGNWLARLLKCTVRQFARPMGRTDSVASLVLLKSKCGRRVFMRGARRHPRIATIFRVEDVARVVLNSNPFRLSMQVRRVPWSLRGALRQMAGFGGFCAAFDKSSPKIHPRHGIGDLQMRTWGLRRPMNGGPWEILTASNRCAAYRNLPPQLRKRVP